MEDNRVTVREAALLLGVSEGAIRKRVDRGTLKHDKDTDGRVYVYLPAGVSNGVDASTTHESDALMFELRSRIAFLEEELRRKDAILLNMTEGLKVLQAAQEPRESPTEASAEPGKGGMVASEAERLSWWRRLFGAPNS